MSVARQRHIPVVLATVVTGTYDISSSDALRTLGGAGSELDRFIVVDQRLPRVLAAILLAGASTALSVAVSTLMGGALTAAAAVLLSARRG